VRQQRELVPLLLAPRAKRRHRVDGQTEQPHTSVHEQREVVTKLTQLPCANTREGHREEDERNGTFTHKLGECQFLTVLIRKGEIGRLCANRENHVCDSFDIEMPARQCEQLPYPIDASYTAASVCEALASEFALLFAHGRERPRRRGALLLAHLAPKMDSVRRLCSCDTFYKRNLRFAVGIR